MIITGSHTVNNKSNKEKKVELHRKFKASSMIDYLENSQATSDLKDTGDLKVLVDGILKGLINEIDHELFPQRPLFLLTADLTNITLEQATTLLNDLTPEKEQIIVKKILESQNKQKRRSKSNRMISDCSKIVLFEKKGIQTDLVAIDDYIQSMYQYIKKYIKKDFVNDLFTSIKKDSMELLNQLQNSDIGSYEHFEVDYVAAAVLSFNNYEEHENYRSKLISEEEERNKLNNDKAQSNNNELVRITKKKRKRFEFDETGLTDNEIIQKKETFRKQEYIHNKALFDAVNESLIQFRPYGKDGEPAPWSNKKRQLQKRPPKSKLNLDDMFSTVKRDMFRWGIMQAGTLPRKDFIFGGTFDEELFNEIREKKLATLLATEVIENEQKWLSYDFEEAQVRIDLGDMILEQLVSE